MTITRHGSMRLVAVSGISIAAIVGILGHEDAVANGGRRSRGDSHAAGDPLPGLSPQLRSLFDRGRAEFDHEFTIEEGLGPLYNETSCTECHGGRGGLPGGPDALGLGSIHNVTHFGHDNAGYFDPLRELGGPVIQRLSIADELPGCTLAPETVPAIANVHSVRHTPAVWGFGLIDAIPDEEILERQNLGIDGIRGVANWGRELQALNTEPTAANPQLEFFGGARVGRFGWKASTATLEQFSAEPFGIELGISSPFFPQEFTAAGLRFDSALPEECRAATQVPNDVEHSRSLLIYAFQALLAPPPRAPMRGAAFRGEAVFEEIGCANCHTPEMRTGNRYYMELADGSSVRVRQLENERVELYSDLLTHEMGPALSDEGGANFGRVQGRADGRRWRTTPLWGMRFKTALLHDGRTDDPRAAILLHGGEAQVVRDRFAVLTARDQAALIAFLMTL